MKIDDYLFGLIRIDGKTYTNDVILYPDGSINASWWRREGHKLHIDDLDRTAVLKPEIVIIGTGASGVMKVEKKTVEYLQKICSSIIVERTGKAVKRFNELSQNHAVEGLFHLTC